MPASKLDSMDRLRAPSDDASDPRVLTSQCGAPAQPKAAAAPVTQPQPQAVPEASRQIDLSGDANFATGSANLTPHAISTLDEFVAADQGVTFRQVAVAGYTDSTGSVSGNLSLSRRRAEAVMQYLKQQGLRSQNFVAQGFGVANPVASNATAAGRAKNRRAEVSVSTR